jgi:hypothetical protein
MENHSSSSNSSNVKPPLPSPISEEAGVGLRLAPPPPLPTPLPPHQNPNDNTPLASIPYIEKVVEEFQRYRDINEDEIIKKFSEAAEKMVAKFIEILRVPDKSRWDPVSDPSLPKLPQHVIADLPGFQRFQTLMVKQLFDLLLRLHQSKVHLAQCQHVFASKLLASLKESETSLEEDSSGYYTSIIAVFHDFTSAIIRQNVEDLTNLQGGTITIIAGDHLQQEQAKRYASLSSLYLFRTHTNCAACKSPGVSGKSLLSKAALCLDCLQKEALFLKIEKPDFIGH